LATLRAIQRRIKSVRNISQVTRAMEMVAASKMRRAQQATLASRAYAEKAWQVLRYVAEQPGRNKTLHPLLEEREQVKTVLLILMTSDRGLCGAFNMNILRTTFDFIKQTDKPVKLVTVGRRGRDLAMRSGKEIIAEFTGLSEKPKMLDIGPIAQIAIEEFTAGRVDQVQIAYTDFINVIRQVPQVKQLLPIVPPKERPADASASAVYLYEPTPEAILDSILPRFTELQIYQALLESVASEHSARMVAMRNATENAHELIDGLSLAYNKARQWNITKEMLDIAGGAEALRQALAKK
jgi:F-type H+-transporting ATPase subunit gamma